MIVFDNGAYRLVDVSKALVLGKITDRRVGLLERKVSAYFGVPVASLKEWRADSEAKKWICFLLVHKLQYSVCSVAKSYNINKYFLKTEISNFYKTCLLDVEKQLLMDAFCNKIT
jgi:hypothetical protein